MPIRKDREEILSTMTPGEFILCMEETLRDARERWSEPGGDKKCLDSIRKTAALGVQCMEVYGIQQRQGHVA